MTLLEMWGECLGKVDGGCIVRDQLLVEDVQVDGLGLGKVKWALDAGVDEDAVQVGVLGNDLRSERGNLLC